MSTIFPKWVNRLPLLLLFAGGGGSLGLIAFFWYYASPWYTEVGYAPVQPVPYSHKLHAGDLGMDCRYCHIGVEKYSFATLPATQTCMNCHQVVKPDSPYILPVRESFTQNLPLQWVRVHKLPEYVKFKHDIHIQKGVSCVNCHGRIDQEPVVRTSTPLSMSWCLDCHRNPAGLDEAGYPRVRPRDKITQLDYRRAAPGEGAQLVKAYHIKAPENCSACHY